MLVRWFALLCAAVIVTATVSAARAASPAAAALSDGIELSPPDLTPELSQDAWAMPASFAGPRLGFWQPAITHGAPDLSPGRVHGVFVFRPPR